MLRLQPHLRLKGLPKRPSPNAGSAVERAANIASLSAVTILVLCTDDLVAQCNIKSGQSAHGPIADLRYATRKWPFEIREVPAIYISLHSAKVRASSISAPRLCIVFSMMLRSSNICTTRGLPVALWISEVLVRRSE